jgi:general secretion pathway protein G
MQSVTSTGKKGSRAFSLVELVIVIVIIGIIAAIAIPRVSRGSRGAGESALASNLAVMRSAIELYASEHGGDYPGAKSDGDAGMENTEEALVSQLTKYSKANGEVSDVRNPAAGFIYGPYLRRGVPPVPVGAYRGSSKVLIDTTNVPPAVSATEGGWVYNPLTGDIIANSSDQNEDGTRTYNNY